MDSYNDARQGRRRDPDAAGGSPHVTLEIAPRSPLVRLGVIGYPPQPPLSESRRGFWRHTAQQRGSVSIWPLTFWHGFRPVPMALVVKA
jgi:hypothetical protein